MFVGIIAGSPHETSLVLLGPPRGLKGLLHVLSAVVSPTKVAWLVFRLFCLLGTSKVQVGGCDKHTILHNVVGYYLHLVITCMI